jgi:hypothetical protein
MIESDHSLTRKPGTNRVTQRIVVENSVVLCGSLDFLLAPLRYGGQSLCQFLEFA